MKMSDPKEVTPEPVPLAAEDDLTGVDLEVDELLGGAVGNEPSDDLNKELDLDELNDNLRDYLEDNLSLEVNFGDGSSCRASDDKLESGAGEERNSSRSVSSERDRASGIDSQDLSDGASETTPTAPESLHTSISEGSQSSESNTGSVQQRNSLEIRNNIPDINETKDYAKDSGEDRNKLQPVGAVPKIRKKSPGLARRLADSMQFEGSDRDTSSSERESEPAQIDTTVHSAQKDFETQLNTQLRCGSAPFASHPVVPPTETTQVPNGLGSKEKSSSFEKLCDSLLGNDPNGLRIPQDSDTSPDDSDKMDPSLKSMEVENEYDYIKYARIQHGDWYVGMRLAYSSSNDSLSAKRSISGGLRASDDEYLGSSREGSPEKTSQRQSKLSDHLSLSKVNEDTLTEIPLNGSDHAGNDEKNFSLSPEATECDSAEVESVLSDEGKSSTSGFPAVEDGLSSSQGSDTEDPIGPEMQTTPAELLKRRYKAEIEQELKSTDLVAFSGDDHQSMSLTDNSSLRSTPSHHSGGSGHDSSHGSEHHSSHSSHSHRHPPEVDAAIQDIKSAIKRSKHAALQHEETLRSGGQQEPIWVMRDSYVRKLGPGNNDIQRVHEEYESHGDDTIDLPQDGGYPVDEETDQYRDFENTDGKTFPSSKGFDSDDEVDDNRGIFNQTRRVKGKQYKALPEAEDDPPYSQHGNHRNLNARKQPNTLVSGPSAHSGTATNRTMGSVRASANNGISGTTDRDSSNRNKNDGVQNPHSFSSAIPHSRYRTVNPPQSQPRLSSSKSPTTAPLVDIGSSNSTSASGTSQQVHSHTDTGYTNPSRTSHSQPSSVTSDLRSQYSESDEEPRNRPRARRRYPSYEYHDDTDDEYYSDSDREPSTYVRRRHMGDGEYDTDEETDELLDKQYMRPDAVDIPELTHPPVNKSAEVGEEQVEKRRSRAREGEKESLTLRDPDNETVLIEGVLFRARYLGSTQLISEGQPSKGLRMMQAQEAVGRIKAPEGENQPSTEVDLFVSIEKIMVLNTDLQEIMMDHALRTISYIADIGDLLVIMARRGPVLSNDAENRKRQTKICCHVFESDEAQLIAQSIGQAFQVAYMEFLKANGIEDTSMFKEIDYQEVLNQQEIFGEELFLFSNKEMQKEVIVPKLKNEPLGVVIVESGWGSMVPTVVLANMSPTGAAARGGQLNIGDQIMSINGVSLVGLPLSSCQTYIKAAKHQTVVKLNVVSCAPVVEVCIKRPDVKYQLGFSVQNGVICSLLRGGIAERGGVRVGHRIIEINGESVVAVPHEKIVKMLATSVGEIHMKTMPTSIFRLLTGQDVPHYI